MWLDLSRDFLGVFKILGSADCVVRVISCNLFWKFLRLGNSAWDFFFGGGVNFWSRDYFGGVLLEALGIFLGFYFCPHSITPVTRNPEYRPGSILPDVKLPKCRNQ